MRFVDGIRRVHLYRGLGSVASLKKAIEDSLPDLIVPCDDGVVFQLHELHSKFPELRELVEKSLGSPDAYPVIRSRWKFLKRAASLGILIPATETVESERDLQRWTSKSGAVLKLDGTWGGSGVMIAKSAQGIIESFRKLSQPVNAGTAWKRWLINHDPLALWSWKKREAPCVTIQEFIDGRPANAMFVSWQGTLLGCIAVEVVTAQGQTGAATVVRVVKNKQIEECAERVAFDLQLSGFHGLDFVIQESTGKAFLIELNPRCTQLGHLRVGSENDLAGALAAKLLGEPALKADCAIRAETIAFFPQTFNWNPKSAYLRNGYHDVPWEQPALVRELLRPSWPDRQILTRIYHHFRAPKRQAEVRF